MNTKIILNDDVYKIVRHVGLDAVMDEMISDLTAAMIGFDHEKYTIPVRQGFQYSKPDPGLLEWMPILAADTQITVKIVGYHPLNPEVHKLPTIMSSLYTYDMATGHLSTIVDGILLTALRTGAASALATKVLAKTDSRTLGLIGCGAQAVTQLHAISKVVDLDKVLIYDIDPAVSKTFISRTRFMDHRDIELIESDLAHLVGSADILCTQTSVGVNDGPVFDDHGLQPWTHINAVGADMPGKTEIPNTVLNRSFVCPDFLAQAVEEGECQQLSRDAIGPELVEVVKNSKRYESLRTGNTVFDSTGWALEDHVAMELIKRYADELDLGVSLPIECVSIDPKNPYDMVSRSPGDGVGESTAKA